MIAASWWWRFHGNYRTAIPNTLRGLPRYKADAYMLAVGPINFLTERLG